MSSQNDEHTFRASNLDFESYTIPASTAVTFYFGEGTDTTTIRYLNVGGRSFGLSILPIATAVALSKINGKTLKSPMSLGTTYGYNSNNGKFTSVTIVAGTTATVVGVHAKGG